MVLSHCLQNQCKIPLSLIMQSSRHILYHTFTKLSAVLAPEITTWIKSKKQVGQQINNLQCIFRCFLIGMLPCLMWPACQTCAPWWMMLTLMLPRSTEYHQKMSDFLYHTSRSCSNWAEVELKKQRSCRDRIEVTMVEKRSG